MAVLDQLIPVPLFSWAFHAVGGYINGDGGVQTLEQAVARGNVMFWPTLQHAWVFWSPASFITFYAVPLKYRTLMNNTMAFTWNAFLSFLVSRRSSEDGLTQVKIQYENNPGAPNQVNVPIS